MVPPTTAWGPPDVRARYEHDGVVGLEVRQAAREAGAFAKKGGPLEALVSVGWPGGRYG
jgi:hypothetical protein